MIEKQKNVIAFWEDQEQEKKDRILSAEVFDFDQFDSLEKFTGTHPSVMQNRIREKNWDINVDISKKRFSTKERLLYWFEKKTGRRLFDFKNYRII